MDLKSGLRMLSEADYAEPEEEKTWANAPMRAIHALF
jgi:hypothetical protein